MLWLALATVLMSDPAAAPTAPSMGPLTALSVQTSAANAARPSRSAPLISPREIRDCRSGLQRINGRIERLPGPAAEPRVRLYHLFNLNDAQGCPIPVIARDHVPEADRAIGRQLYAPSSGPRMGRRVGP